MKKYITLLFFLVIIFAVGGSVSVEATESLTTLNDPTSVGITLVKDDTVTPPAPKPPVKDDVPLLGTTAEIAKPGRRLPSTGELITSLIWIILGLSMLIVVVGVFSLRNIMQNLAWE
ncbi:hypothetical protein [Enterococcus rivorum]|uniref:Gram-positive cocci surface proteins LPxTG domain-containing protein n=1 Tax=Enterococcus rivorum TaxID=762845 RepID=A0A1E5KWZ8_9ENTE|nr:hypothetical protein [Enterococcus rivorum]MBP2097247.1 hypothetical protein [Enterococcus rivorum]OEH82400.1 hypothetical protein BCR26_02920 [Enterococcus rivorum]